MCWEKQRVTIGIRAGRSVRPSSWVVSVVWRLNTVVVFSYFFRCVVNKEWGTLSRTKIF